MLEKMTIWTRKPKRKSDGIFFETTIIDSYKRRINCSKMYLTSEHTFVTKAKHYVTPGHFY